MKKTVLHLFFSLVISHSVLSQNEFITTWQSTNSYPSITIPTKNGLAYNYTVDWGDGSVNNNVNGDISHNYAMIGNYTVTITGIFPAIDFSKIVPGGLDPYNADGLLSVEQWGNNQWKTMEGAFKGQRSLVINAIDAPDLSQCSNMSEMFEDCRNLNNSAANSLNGWNTSTITNMSYLFDGSNFNKPLNNWDTSGVTNMSFMFISSDFNQAIGNWNVSNVTDMSYMFRNSQFNQPIGNWNVSKVENMHQMFYDNETFNQSIDNWDVSSVTDMSFMFQLTRDFNQSLNSWDVSSVTTMEQMFFDCNFNENITSWNVANVIDMNAMFFLNDDFNQDIGAWNVSKVQNMNSMFVGTIFNQDISNWDVSSLENMSAMFSSNTVFNQDIGNWNTANVTNMRSTFSFATAFDQDISNWNVEKVTSCFRMFDNAGLSTANYDALLIAWNAQNLQDEVLFDAGDSKYSSPAAEAARQNMIDNDEWSITDGGKLEIFTWTGAVNTDWNTAGNWDTNAVPTQDDDVILADVANAPRINFNQSYTVKSLLNHEILTIKTNASLTVLEDLDQRNNIIVESFVNGSGSFILRGNQINNNPSNLTYFRYASGNNWHLISNPTENQDIDVFVAATPLAEGQGNNRGLAFYNEDNLQGWSYYQAGANDSGNFTSGKGYALNLSANSFLRFEGLVKDDDLSNYPIVDVPTQWNLIGNPYPAHINANVNADANNNFLTENADQLDPAFANIYLWNPTTNSYDPIGNGLAAKYITPGQGFFIRTKNGGGTIDINKTMQTHQIGDVFLKQNEPTKIEINLNSDAKTSKSTIVFKENMTFGLDVTYDAAVFDGTTNNHYIYSKIVDESSELPFAIQFLPEIEDNQFIVPLGVKNTDDKNLNLSFNSTIPTDINIILEDRKLNTFTNINTANTYNFEHIVDNESDRFFLHIQNQALTVDSIHQKKINIYKNSDNSISIDGVVNGTLNVYTITGKTILKSKKINQNHQQIQLPKLAKGIYLFEIKTNSSKLIKKILF